MEGDQCQRCGTPTLPDAKFCESCGVKLAAAGAPQAQPQNALPFAPAPIVQPANAAALPYQGVAIRFVAILIDSVIIAIISGILTLPLQTPIFVVTVIEAPSVATGPNPLAWLAGAVSLLIFLLYYILLEGAYGQTVGKMAVKIKVVRDDGTNIEYADAAVRNLLRIIDLIPFFIPYLLGAIFVRASDTKQRVGDRAASTVVVRAEA